MIYQIPGDVGKPWRFMNFIEYMTGDNDDNAAIIKYFVKHRTKGKKDYNKRMAWLVYLYSTCHSWAAAAFMSEILDYSVITEKDLNDFWRENKPRLLFQSDRRYVKHMNQFVTMATEFLAKSERDPYGFFQSFNQGTPEEVYKKIYKEVSSWSFYGRFGTGMLLKGLWLFGDMEPDSICSYDWNAGSTTTAAFFTVMYQDERSLDFGLKERRKTARVTAEEKVLLDAALSCTVDYLRKNFPNQRWGIQSLLAEACPYYKMYKGARYNGYYVDRQQEELIQLQKDWPEYGSIWDLCWEARRKSIPVKYLGEVNGWEGIRTSVCRRFLDTGKVDVYPYKDWKGVAV